MRIKYISDYSFSVRFDDDDKPQVFVQKTPIACVVSDEYDNIGISFCCDAELRGDRFSKDRAKEIAFGRATTGHNTVCPNRKLTNRFGKRVTLLSEVRFWENKFKESARVSQ